MAISDTGNDAGDQGMKGNIDPLVGTLEVLAGPNKGMRYVLTGPTTVIGRGTDQDLALADVACSRRHFMIIRDEETYRLRDLDSSNGTLVNGTRTERCELSNGDVIQIGRTAMLFELTPEIKQTLMMAPVESEAALPADVPAAHPSDEAEEAKEEIDACGPSDDDLLEEEEEETELRAELFASEETLTTVQAITTEEAAKDPRLWPEPLVANRANWKVRIDEVISEGRPELGELMEECSGLSFSRGELVAAHARADFVEFIDVKAGSHRRVELPKGGLRVSAGLKRDAELSIEAVMAGRDYRGEFLLAFGSGRNSDAQRIVRIRVGSGDLDLWVVEAKWLYSALAQLPCLGASTLNIEGAAVIRPSDGGSPIVRFCQRGNGQPQTGEPVTSVTIDIHQTVLIGYLERCRQNPNAQFGDELTNVRRYDLGEIDGISLGFSDACGMSDGNMLYVAVAEDCPAVGISGLNHGTVLGITDGTGKVQHAAICEPDGTPTTSKVAALTIDDQKCIYVALQATETTPPRLCRLKVDGAPI